MRIFPDHGDLLSVSVFDPSKKYGEEGQVKKYSGNRTEMLAVAEAARATSMEVRFYYRSVETGNGEMVSAQVVITDIPPGHVQPFHTHEAIHEVTLVLEGSVTAIDNEELGEDARDGLRASGRTIGPFQMVIEGPGTRHTIFNDSDAYARLVTIQSARMPLTEFPKDWIRK